VGQLKGLGVWTRDVEDSQSGVTPLVQRSKPWLEIFQSLAIPPLLSKEPENPLPARGFNLFSRPPLSQDLTVLTGVSSPTETSFI
jgi:hypothetical protein